MESKESNNNDGQRPTRQDPLGQNISENVPMTYKPVYHHWFVKKENDGKVKWTPLSMIDSMALETAFTSQGCDAITLVSTEGGRFDVNITTRQRTSVYWQSAVGEVRRCSWFHKRNNDGKYIPYEEDVALRLEDEYMDAFQTNNWHRKVQLDSGECVMFHGPDVLVLFPQAVTPDAWGNGQNQTFRPRVVKRGLEDFEIEDGEPDTVDHLLFMVHGIGSVCDLKFRSVEEVVDEFRSVSLQLIQSHYRSSCEKKIANRVEVLPISWHEKLHEETGVDEKLKGITLESIPKLRDFANDTILDVLFYTSPVYCQTIVTSVGKELNRIFDLFKQRNPNFTGDVSLGGHSLGSLILFDVLCHQQHIEVENKAHSEPVTPTTSENKDGEEFVSPLIEKPEPKQRRMSRRISYMMSAIGTGQPHINYPQLNFQPRNFFALGSPIGMFVTVRGLDTLGEKFELPTCEHFFNIFHPYDPVAYRIESLINPELATLKPVLIPHHKGRKRMHLELKETMTRVGADIKTKVLDSMKATWMNFSNFSVFKQAEEASLTIDANNSIREECGALNASGARLRQDSTDEYTQMINTQQTNLPLGALNKGRRVDYVLQEAPLEFFNEYIFALTSHVCYWESEDTMLLILKEIYSSMGIQTDSQIPQQTMSVSVERPPSTSSSSSVPRTSQCSNGSSSSPPSPEPLY